MADVASALRSWSATAASNSPSGTTAIGAGLDDNLRQIQAVVRQYLASSASNMASAATVDLSTADGFYVNITGTVTITGLGTEGAGIHYLLKFAGALTFTHNATSLILPGAANITTAAGDMAWMISEGSGNWRCLFYTSSANNTPPLRSTFTATITGMTVSVTGTAAYSVTNNVATVFYPVMTGTSNTTACTITGQPAAIKPTTAHTGYVGISNDNGAATAARFDVGTDGVITLYKDVSASAFTASGAKGIGAGFVVTYNLN